MKFDDLQNLSKKKDFALKKHTMLLTEHQMNDEFCIIYSKYVYVL